MKSIQVIVLRYLVYLQREVPCAKQRRKQVNPFTEVELEKMRLPLAASMMFRQLSTPWVHVSADERQFWQDGTKVEAL